MEENKQVHQKPAAQACGNRYSFKLSSSFCCLPFFLPLVSKVMGAAHVSSDHFSCFCWRLPSAWLSLVNERCFYVQKGMFSIALSIALLLLMVRLKSLCLFPLSLFLES